VPPSDEQKGDTGDRRLGVADAKDARQMKKQSQAGHTSVARIFDAGINHARGPTVLPTRNDQSAERTEPATVGLCWLADG